MVRSASVTRDITNRIWYEQSLYLVYRATQNESDVFVTISSYIYSKSVLIENA